MVSPTPFRLAEFKSAYGPQYSFRPNVGGTSVKQLTKLGLKTGFFGAAAGVGLMLFVSGIPRVQKDVLQPVPLIGQYFTKAEVDPADNPF